MIGHVKAIRLFNIQSWGETKGNTLNLADDKVNVIIARNETGKSVLFKVFRQMCFPNFYGRTGRKDLIRRGQEKGMALISLVTGETIVFEVYKTYQIYKLYENKELVGTWRQDSIPEVLREKLGWYIDEEFKILLNVIDLEMPAPFVESSEKFNARVLKFVVEDDEMAQSIESYKNWIETLNNLEKKQIEEINLLRAKASVYKVVETYELEQHIKKQRRVLTALEGVTPITEMMEELVTVQESKPVDECNEIDHDKLEEVMKGVYAVEALSSLLTELPNKPEEKTQYSKLEEVSAIINMQNQITELGWLLREAEDNKPPQFEVKDEQEVEYVLKSLTDIWKIEEQLRELQLTLIKRNDTEFYLKDSVNNIKRLEKELGVCPLCGEHFQEKGEHIHAD